MLAAGLPNGLATVDASDLLPRGRVEVGVRVEGRELGVRSLLADRSPLLAGGHVVLPWSNFPEDGGRLLPVETGELGPNAAKGIVKFPLKVAGPSRPLDPLRSPVLRPFFTADKPPGVDDFLVLRFKSSCAAKFPFVSCKVDGSLSVAVAFNKFVDAG